MDERSPENTPAPLPPRATAPVDAMPAFVVLAIPVVRENPSGPHALRAARGRPHAPTHLLASALLI